MASFHFICWTLDRENNTLSQGIDSELLNSIAINGVESPISSTSDKPLALSLNFTKEQAKNRNIPYGEENFGSLLSIEETIYHIPIGESLSINDKTFHCNTEGEITIE